MQTVFSFTYPVVLSAGAYHTRTDVPWQKPSTCFLLICASSRLDWTSNEAHAYRACRMEGKMSILSCRRFWLTGAIIVACVALHVSSLQSQARGGTPKTDKLQPVNSGANPYHVIRD